MIDSHSHFDMPVFDLDREAAWARARAAGVRAAIIPGVEPASWDRTIAAGKPGERFVALGIHPQALPDLGDRDVTDGLASLQARARACGAVAIGECGFDGAIDLTRAPFARQTAAMATQVEIARALGLPMIVHVFRAHGEALAALRSVRLPQPPGVIHSYSGSVELLREYLALGFAVSFAGAITRPNARRPVVAARAVPLDRLLLETDSPDQLPTGADELSGMARRCEPAHLTVTLAHLARIRDSTAFAIAEATRRNTTALFGLAIDA